MYSGDNLRSIYIPDTEDRPQMEPRTVSEGSISSYGSADSYHIKECSPMNIRSTYQPSNEHNSCHIFRFVAGTARGPNIIEGQFDDAPEDTLMTEETLLSRETLKESDNDMLGRCNSQYEDASPSPPPTKRRRSHDRYQYQVPTLSSDVYHTATRSPAPSFTGQYQPPHWDELSHPHYRKMSPGRAPLNMVTPSPPPPRRSTSTGGAPVGQNGATKEQDSSAALPPNREYVTVLNDNDVLCGRGKGVNDYVGNKRFRALIRRYREEYLHSCRGDKTNIARLIVEVVKQQSPSGRFLKKVPNSRYWYIVEKQVALEKTSQALREGSPRHSVTKGQGAVPLQQQQQQQQSQQTQTTNNAIEEQVGTVESEEKDSSGGSGKKWVFGSTPYVSP